MLKRTNVILLTVVTLTLLTTSANAGLWQKFKSTRFWPFHWPETLMVTANYTHPRLLAEVAQRKTNLPIILISSEGSDERLYYLPPKDKAMSLDEEKYMEFIDVMMRPERVVFIGGGKYIPETFIDRVKEKYPTVTVAGSNWLQNAEQLDSVINASGLTKDYRKALQNLLTAERSEGAPGDDLSQYKDVETDSGNTPESDTDFPFFEE